jgi:hypothetical protein
MSCNVVFNGNGWCDADQNTEACNWDGGDCCAETCVFTDDSYGSCSDGFNCLDPLYATTSPPTDPPTDPPTSAPTQSPSDAPTQSPTSTPAIVCPQFFSFDDSHGSYELWTTSFFKFDGYFQVFDDDDDDDDDDDSVSFPGYVPAMYVIQALGIGGVKPSMILGLSPGPGATFSVVGGKLDANGALMPCDIEASGSGPCFTTRSWEIGLGAKSFYNSFYTTETAAWTSPFGSSVYSECFEESDGTNFLGNRVRPVTFTGEARGHNNVPPPSFHAPAPLPHDSVEFSLTLKDGGGQGWWNTLKFHPNQYVLDDGEKIVHRGTLVDKAEVTDKVSSSFLLSLPFPSPLSASFSFPHIPFLLLVAPPQGGLLQPPHVGESRCGCWR